MWIMKQNDNTNQEISDNTSENTGESTWPADNKEDDLHYEQEVVHLGEVRWDKSLQTTRIPLPKKESCTDTFIAHPPLPNSRNPAETMAPELLTSKESTLLNKLSESDHAPSSQVLPLCKSKADHNVPHQKASADENIPQHQTAMFEVAKGCVQYIIFLITPWQILFDDKYLMVEQVLQLAIEAQIVGRHYQVQLYICHLDLNCLVIHLLKLIHKHVKL